MKTQPSTELVLSGTGGRHVPAHTTVRSCDTVNPEVVPTIESDAFCDHFGRLESLLESHQLLIENESPPLVLRSLRTRIASELHGLREADAIQFDHVDVESEEAVPWLQQLLDQFQRRRANQLLSEPCAENPNPVLQVSFDGGVLDGNPAAAEFVGALMMEFGSELQDFFRQAITSMLNDRKPASFEVRNGDRDYILTVTPVTGADYVYIYGQDVSSIKASERKAQQLALQDPLTGLPNRILLKKKFHQEMLNAQHNRLPLSVAFVDLDNFKEINDTLGHQAGDATLNSIAKHLETFGRSCDTVARWGGDEFVILLPGLDAAAAEKACEQLRENVQRQAARADQCFATLTLGLATFPDNGHDPEQLLKVADEALLKAKNERKARLESNTRGVLSIQPAA